MAEIKIANSVVGGYLDLIAIGHYCSKNIQRSSDESYESPFEKGKLPEWTKTEDYFFDTVLSASIISIVEDGVT